MKEPTTSLTDFLLAAELFLFSWLTFQTFSDQISVNLWGLSLALLGLSALAGGIYHGFTPTPFLWRTTAISIVATFGFMVAAGIVSLTDGLLRLALLSVVEVPLLILILKFSVQQQDSIQVRDSRMRILILMILAGNFLGYQLYAAHSNISIWILSGSLIVLFGAWVQQSGFTLHKHFNHNDLCHVIFMIGMYFLYRGGLLFRDR